MTDFDIYTNRVPFGLLTDAERTALMAHGGPWEWTSSTRKWDKTTKPAWVDEFVYRAVRKPVETTWKIRCFIDDGVIVFPASDPNATITATFRDGKLIGGTVEPRE